MRWCFAAACITGPRNSIGTAFRDGRNWRPHCRCFCGSALRAWGAVSAISSRRSGFMRSCSTYCTHDESVGTPMCRSPRGFHIDGHRSGSLPHQRNSYYAGLCHAVKCFRTLSRTGAPHSRICSGGSNAWPCGYVLRPARMADAGYRDSRKPFGRYSGRSCPARAGLLFFGYRHRRSYFEELAGGAETCRLYLGTIAPARDGGSRSCPDADRSGHDIPSQCHGSAVAYSRCPDRSGGGDGGRSVRDPAV